MSAKKAKAKTKPVLPMFKAVAGLVNTARLDYILEYPRLALADLKMAQGLIGEVINEIQKEHGGAL